jgi:hypothetical protein
MDKENHNRPLANEVKKHFLEIISTYNKYQEMIERKSDMIEVCENLGGIIEAARELALRESEDWFDKHTIKRNMSELDKLGKQFDKLAIEARGQDQRLISLYEDMGNILSRYYKFGDLTEEEMKKRLAIQESVREKLDENYVNQSINEASLEVGDVIKVQRGNSLQKMNRIDDKWKVIKKDDNTYTLQKKGSSMKVRHPQSKVDYLIVTDTNSNLPFIKESVNEEVLNEGWFDIVTQGALVITATLWALKGMGINNLSDAKKVFLNLKKTWKDRHVDPELKAVIMKMANDADIVKASKEKVFGPRGGKRPQRESDAAFAEVIKKKLSSSDFAILKKYSDEILRGKVSRKKHGLKDKDVSKRDTATAGNYMSQHGFSKSSKRFGESVNEGVMKELDILAKESKTFKDFTKKVFSEFDNLPKNRDTMNWLEGIYNGVDESLTEKFNKAQLDLLRTGYGNINKINPNSEPYKKLIALLDRIDKSELKQIANADIKFVSMLAKNRLKESIDEAIGASPADKKKVYDKLNKGDKVRIIYGSSIKNHENTFVVTKGKTVVGKQRVERITLANVNNPKGVKHYLYNRNGNIGMAIGDMGAVIKKMEPVNESINEGIRKDWAEYIEDMVGTFNNAIFGKLDKKSTNDDINFTFTGSKFAADGIRRELEKQFRNGKVMFAKKGDNYQVHIDTNFYKKNPELKGEAAHGYKDSTSSYIQNHNDEYKMAVKINKSVKGDEIAFYDELEKLHQKLKHAKYMIWLSNSLRGYKVDMYKDPKIKNKAEAEEALYKLTK